MEDLNVENAKKFHLFLDTLHANNTTSNYYFNLNRIWKYLRREFKNHLIYPTSCTQENSNLILIWSNDEIYSELEMTEEGFVSMLFQLKNQTTLYETSIKQHTLPTLDWMLLMKKKFIN